ncbi:nucleotidyltransferase domain-containing protein [Flavobacterium sp. J372]|uniref:nucleotidyltransferase family protein n=1 Tax=Flavobacterium sp. J372 TaxID=2898436 RepID=UPI0021514353|nr:nucleotidyltransferase domain-containing protein [Flavobacterium sp. J372]MCR5860937.1 nucleotidyltransferase domain-containing protein [Flavobacterium sp. J372]
MQIISNNIDRIKKLCASHNVDTMYLFGSALRNDFNRSSDIDFLVKFKPGNLAGYFDNYLNLKQSLKNLLGREVDLVEEQTLRNPVLINSINRNKELIYG